MVSQSPSVSSEVSRHFSRDTPSAQQDGPAIKLTGLKVGENADLEEAVKMQRRNYPEPTVKRMLGYSWSTVLSSKPWSRVSQCQESLLFNLTLSRISVFIRVFQSLYTNHPPLSDRAGSIAVIGAYSTSVMYLFTPFRCTHSRLGQLCDAAPPSLASYSPQLPSLRLASPRLFGI
jgi:hypothetical protein